MLFGIYGLSKKQPVLKYMWPERELESADSFTVGYEYNDAIEVGRIVDHITCHADGRFHIKTRSEKDIYIQRMQRTEALGPDTATFMDMILISDLANNYTAITKPPKKPHAWADLAPDNFLSSRGMFSGVNYPLEEEVASLIPHLNGVSRGLCLTSGTIKGIFLGQTGLLPEDARIARPSGTILSFKFPIAEDKWHLKAFLFE